MSKTKSKTLEHFLTPNQKELFDILSEMYKGKSSICKDNYILVKGEAPVMLVAHLDTVHDETVRHICTTDNGNVLMSPQGIGGDDRCGAYALVTAYEQSKVKPWLLFTCDEETGGIGAKTFCTNYKEKKLPANLKELKLLIEIDRKGKDEAVYYDCDNEEFEAYITGKGFYTKHGSFSDISLIAPALGVAAVNLSAGYYNAHTKHEYIVRSHLSETINRVIEIIGDSVKPDFPKYDYVEASYDYSPYDYYPMDYAYYLESESESELDGIPHFICREYLALLDFYTADELEKYREKYGDEAILMLYEYELGYN